MPSANPKKQKSKKRADMSAAVDSSQEPSFVQDLVKVFTGSGTSAQNTICLKPYIENQKVEDLLMWRNTAKSGIVFGGISIVYFLLVLSGLGFFFIFSSTLMIGVLGMFAWNKFGDTIKYPAPALPPYLQSGITEKEIQQFSEKYLGAINQGVAVVYKLVSGSDALLTGKCVIALFLVARINAMVSPFTLAYLTAFVAFTFPKFYEMRKDEIDVVTTQINAKLQQLHDMFQEKVMNKIPAAKKTE